MTNHSSTEAYFEVEGPLRFSPTEHAGGAWDPAELHIAPALGLLTHLVEADRDRRRGDTLQLARLSCDILGTLDMAAFDVTVSVLRPGRTIELVEARLEQGGRTGVIARAWLAQRYDTARYAGSGNRAIPSVEECGPWDPTGMWPGGMLRTIQVRRDVAEPGRGVAWLRTDVALLADEQVSPTARMLGLVDVANGMATRVAPSEVAFPNLDLTAHLFRVPESEWVGLDTRVSFGPTGAGLTQSVLHDEHGPVGAIEQCLTVRPGR